MTRQRAKLRGLRRMAFVHSSRIQLRITKVIMPFAFEFAKLVQ